MGDEMAGENICGYKLLISPKRRGITLVPLTRDRPLEKSMEKKYLKKKKKKKKNLSSEEKKEEEQNRMLCMEEEPWRTSMQLTKYKKGT